jgi:hypothetical protein
MANDAKLAAVLEVLASAREAEALALRAVADALVSVATPDESVVDSRTAVAFGLTPGEFRAAVSRGELPASRIGRRNVAKRADVLALLERRRVKPKAGPGAAGERHESVDEKIDRLLNAGRLRSVRPR